MKAYIIKEKCPAEKRMFKPLSNCPTKAIEWIEDADAPLGCRMEISAEKFDGFGICVPLCCGYCIELK